MRITSSQMTFQSLEKIPEHTLKAPRPLSGNCCDKATNGVYHTKLDRASHGSAPYQALSTRYLVPDKNIRILWIDLQSKSCSYK